MENKAVGSVAAASLVLLACPESANAVEVVSVPLNQLLSNGGSYAGVMNLASFLQPSSGNTKAVTSATLTAFGYSDSQATFQENAISTMLTGQTSRMTTYTYSYSCGGWWSSRTCYGTGYGYATDSTYRTDTTAVYADAIVDKMNLNVGEGNGSDSVDFQSAVATAPVYQYSTSNGSYYGGYTTTNFYQNSSNAGYFGNLLASANLTSGDINALNGSGLLQFTVSAPVGTFTLSNVTLNFELTDVAPSVPEPSTWAMMVIGFGAVGAAVRRRKKDLATA